jgi:hypothetical protein
MFIGKILASGPFEITQKTGAGTGWKGLGTKVEVVALQKEEMHCQ